MGDQSQAKVNAAWDKFSVASRELKLARDAAYRQVEKDVASLSRASDEAYEAYWGAANEYGRETHERTE